MNYVRLLCATVVVLGFYCFTFPNERLLDPVLTLLFTATFCALGAYVWSQRQLYGEFRFTPNVVIASALFIWHLGFVGVYITGLATDHRLIEYFELSPHSNVEGVSLAATGIAAFIFGLTSGEAQCKFFLKSPDPSVATVSSAVIGTGALLVCAYFAFRGRALVGEYDSVFTDAPYDPQHRIFNFGLMLAIVGLAPAIVFGDSKRALIVTIGAAIGVAVPAALMGTRWVFLVMVALVVSALQVRGQRISLVLIAVVGVVCMFGSIIVKELRAGHPMNMKTVGDYLNGRYTHPVVEFFEETGHALIVCTYAADEFRIGKRRECGKTFWQALRSVLPGGMADVRAERPMFTTAQAMYPVRFVTEGFTMGYSIFAEWFVNFGMMGVVLGSGLTGLALGAVWRLACRHGEYSWTALSYGWAGYLTFGFRNDAMTWLRFVVWSAAIVVMIGAAITALRPHLENQPVRPL